MQINPHNILFFLVFFSQELKRFSLTGQFDMVLFLQITSLFENNSGFIGPKPDYQKERPEFHQFDYFLISV